MSGFGRFGVMRNVGKLVLGSAFVLVSMPLAAQVLTAPASAQTRTQPQTTAVPQPEPVARPSPGAVARATSPTTDASRADVPWDEIDRVLKESPEPAAPPQTVTGAIGSTDPESETDEDEAPVAAQSGAPTTPAKPGNATAATPPRPLPDAGPQDVAVVQTYDGPEDPTDPDAFAPQSDAPDVPEPPAAKPATPAKPVVRTPPAYTLPLAEYFRVRGPITLAKFDAEDRKAAAAFYEARLNEPLWVTKDGLDDGARSALDVFQTADEWGLDPAAFKAETFANLFDRNLSDDERVDADVKLTMTALLYARHARGGRIPDPTTQLSSYLDRKPNLRNPATVLEDLANAPDKGAALLSLQPQNDQFEALRQQLLALRTAPKEEIVTIPSGRLIKEGQSHADIALIRERLKVAAPGMKKDGTAADDTYYDATLAAAVKRFKESRDISPVTSAITKTLRNALNERNEVSPDLLLANMEEWRWMPDDLGDFHIEVNIPEYMVRVFDKGRVIHTERVVTGQTSTQTPVFSHKLTSVVFQPVWNVPQSIMVNEILPGLRAGRNSIGGRGLVAKRNGRTVDPWSVDWYSTDIRNYHIYQPPGPGNALGVVKFLFPNKHAVYLHDTPTKGLFNESSRAFSHGCIRVRNPVRLAEVIMEKDRAWDGAVIKDLLDRGPENNDVTLNKPVPVHITYFTARVDDSGKLQTFKDVYGHQKRIDLALAGKWDSINKGSDHLAPVAAAPVSRSRPRARYTDADGWYDDYEYRNRRDSRRRAPSGYYAYGYDDDRPRRYRRDDRRYYPEPRRKKPNFFDQLFGN